jgi:hypothetical protein
MAFLKFTLWLFSILLLGIVSPASGSLKDIHRGELPQKSSIVKVYADALSVEPMVQIWTETWRHPVPKEDVVSVLQSCLAELKKETATSGDNEELWLLTGLVAHYGYNVDIGGTHELATKAFAEAHRLSPDDPRPEWFLGSLVCETQQSSQGMSQFLSLEQRIQWEKLPVNFWDDYLYCTTVTLMPAHSLRAISHLQSLNAPPSAYRDSLREIAQKRIDTPDPSAAYSKEVVWRFDKSDSRVTITNPMFGFRFFAPESWNMLVNDAKAGLTLAQIKVGPFPSSAGDVTPNILVLVRLAKPGESLEDFLKTFMRYPMAAPTHISHCPSDTCLASHAVEAGAYKAAGDGHITMAVFQRKLPQFPGVQFEDPMALPASVSEKGSYFRPEQRMGRLNGTLYYLIALDTASSVMDKANAAYELFLNEFQVE